MNARRGAPLLLVLLLAACLPVHPPQVYQPWKYADLRLVSAADSPHPNLDLIAIYTRRAGIEWQVRLDLLELPDLPDSDLYLALDTTSSGRRDLPIAAESSLDWDILLVMPAHGGARALDAELQPLSGLGLRVIRQPQSDSLEISLRQPPGAGMNFKAQAFLTEPGSPELVDSLPPVSLFGAPPPRAAVLFAFWNNLPAYSPAQALRRWNGAHSGPLGGRHGLYNLLRAARATRTPLALMDLNTATVLPALDFVDGTRILRNMSRSGLLILPQSLPGFAAAGPPYAPLPAPDWAAGRAVLSSQEADQAFGLPDSPFAFAPLGLPPTDLPVLGVFTPLKEPTNTLQTQAIARRGGVRLIPVPAYGAAGEPPEQATLQGPSLEARRALAQAAVGAARGEAALLVLGGDLARSAWGNPQAARASFDYIAAHPWIHPQSAYDLLTFPLGDNQGLLSSPRQPTVRLEGDPRVEQFLAQLEAAPGNPAGDSAWQAYLALFAPAAPAPPELADLRAAYLPQVQALLEAARWASHPYSQASCAGDPDGDGQVECLLSSESVWLLAGPDGSLHFAFARTPHLHQWIGPSSQFTSGLSDASQWDPGRGLRADPSVIPGAFDLGLESGIQVQVGEGELAFSSSDGENRLSYRLLEDGLQVEILSKGQRRLQIPLVLDPWQRIGTDWAQRYSAQAGPQTYTWQVRPDNGPAVQVRVTSSAPLKADTFLDSLQLLGGAEDPNREYPPGHYLPFPLALLETGGQERTLVEFQLSESP